LPSEFAPLLELIVLRWKTDVSKEEAEEIYVTLFKEFHTNEEPDTEQKVREYMCSSITITFGVWRKYHHKKLALACLFYEAT